MCELGMSQTVIENIKTELCRLCLAHTTVYFPLRQDTKESRMLKTLTAILIEPKEQFPSVICYKCCLNLNLAYKIQQNMIRTEEKFRSQFCLVQIKEEADLIANEENMNVTDSSSVVSNFDDTSQEEENIALKKVTVFPELQQLRQMCTNFPIKPEDTPYLSQDKIPKGEIYEEEEEQIPLATAVKEEKQPGDFLCHICDKAFRDKITLGKHKYNHMKKFCNICRRDIGFTSFRRHMKSHILKNEIPKENSPLNQEIKIKEEPAEETTEFQCNICSKYFSNKEKFSKHARQVHVKKTCKICQEEFMYANFGRHLRQHAERNEFVPDKEPPSEFHCNVCSKNFENDFKLKRHQSVMHIKKKCKICNKEFVLGSFGRHMRRHRARNEVVPEEPKIESPSEFECDICNKFFITRLKLRKHQSGIHSTRKCKICGKDCLKATFKRHVRVCHPEEFENYIKEVKEEYSNITYNCKFCSRSFKHQLRLSSHIMSVHEKWICNSCGEEVELIDKPKHLQNHANDDLQTPPIETKITIYTCDHCNKNFASPVLLRRHEYLHKRSRCPICDKDISTPNLNHHVKTHSDAFQQICELCGATLKHRFSLKKHMILVHQDAKFKCQFCDKFFKFPTVRKYHELKEHSDKKNFVCDVCGKKFYLSNHLRNHVNSLHLKLTVATCTVCEKSFSTKFALTTHMRIHTNETPYKCEVCGEGFRQKVSLKSHLRSKHHVEEKMTVFCKICHKGFASKVALYTHERSIHG